MEFVNPKLLLLIWLTPLIAFWWVWAQRRRETAIAAFMSRAMQAKLAPRDAKARMKWQIGLLLTGLFLGTIAMSQPQWGERQETVFHRGRDIVIALDVSRSMLANDVYPNRLTRAKTDLIDLIAELRGDRAALVAFRKDAQLICPLSTDYAFLRHALDGCGVHSAAAGETDIGGAIYKAMDSFDNETAAHKAIVLISDGEDLEGKAIAAAEKAAERGISIFTVGLGSGMGSRIPVTDDKTKFVTHKGESVVTRLENETLDKIATITDGAYAPIATASTASHTLGDIYRQHLVKISEQDIEEKLQLRRVERYQWFLLPALLCFLFSAGLSRGRLARRSRPHDEPGRAPSVTPPARATVALFLLLGAACAAGSATGQTNSPGEGAQHTLALRNIPEGRAGARLAQTLYRRGEFAAAAETYLKAAEGSTRDAALNFKFNAAVSLFKAGEFVAAKELFNDLSHQADESEIEQIERALGLACYNSAQALDPNQPENLAPRSELLHEASEAFRRASRSATQDEDAHNNLAIALDEYRAAESDAHIAALMEKYQAQNPGQLAAEMLSRQRQILKGLAMANTNMSPSRITEFESIADQQKEVADLWIPLKGKIIQAASQPDMTDAQLQQLAQLNHQIEATRQNMLDASEQLGDLKTESDQLTQTSEVAVYQLWKSVAPHDLVLQEELRQQSNCVNWISQPGSAPHQDPGFLPAAQGEARSLTDLFKERFDQAMAAQASAPPGMDAPPGSPEGAGPPQAQGLNPETIQQINELLRLATLAQDETLTALQRSPSGPAAFSAREAYQYLIEIDKLLPKDSPQQSQQEQQQDAQNSEQQQAAENPNAPQEKQEDETPSESQPPSAAQTNETENAESPEPADMLPEELEKLLERALRREKEHESDRRKKLDRIPLAPMERDW